MRTLVVVDEYQQLVMPVDSGYRYGLSTLTEVFGLFVQLCPFMSAAEIRLTMSADEPIVLSSDSMHVCPSEVHIVLQLAPSSAKNHFTQFEATNVPSLQTAVATGRKPARTKRNCA